MAATSVLLRLSLYVCGSSAQSQGILPGLAPWYCPPLGVEESACVRHHRFGQAPLYVESSLVPLSVKVVLAVAQEVGEEFADVLQAFLAKIEAVRLITCTGRFQACYKGASASEALGELCGYVDGLEGSLSSISTQEENLCKVLFSEGDGRAVLRAISMPLQKLVELAFPAAAPAEVGNFGSRFDFEHFFAKRAEVFSRHKSGIRDQILYPPIFSPDGICSLGEDRTTQSIGPNVSMVLQLLQAASVPMSHFVVNFGAADGECGAEEDWNADPANCLTTAGYSAIVVEGDRKFYAELRRRFGQRANVSLVLQFLPLHNVTHLLKDLLATMETSSAFPDLFKVDVDHADCLFMEEALRVIQPKVIHVEYMPQAPPPLEYVQHYQPSLLQVDLQGRAEPLLLQERLWKPSAQFIWSEEQLQKKTPVDEGTALAAKQSGREMTGCSLAAFLARAPGYSLLAAGDEEAVLLRKDLVKHVGEPPSALDAWIRGSFCNPWRLTNGPDYAVWGFDFRVLADQSHPLSQRRQELDQMLKAHGARAFSLNAADA